jgi:hypothetical protein
MDLERARSSPDAERTRVQQLLANLGVDRTDDHEAERDASYPAQPLAQQGVDDAVAARLRGHLRRSIVVAAGIHVGQGCRDWTAPGHEDAGPQCLSCADPDHRVRLGDHRFAAQLLISMRPRPVRFAGADVGH